MAIIVDDPLRARPGSTPYDASVDLCFSMHSSGGPTQVVIEYAIEPASGAGFTRGNGTVTQRFQVRVTVQGTVKQHCERVVLRRNGAAGPALPIAVLCEVKVRSAAGALLQETAGSVTITQ
jgi:hypothetical protein